MYKEAWVILSKLKNVLVLSHDDKSVLHKRYTPFTFGSWRWCFGSSLQCSPSLLQLINLSSIFYLLTVLISFALPRSDTITFSYRMSYISNQPTFPFLVSKTFWGGSRQYRHSINKSNLNLSLVLNNRMLTRSFSIKNFEQKQNWDQWRSIHFNEMLLI
jgi:hypothetical protein